MITITTQQNMAWWMVVMFESIGEMVLLEHLILIMEQFMTESFLLIVIVGP